MQNNEGKMGKWIIRDWVPNAKGFYVTYVIKAFSTAHECRQYKKLLKNSRSENRLEIKRRWTKDLTKTEALEMYKRYKHCFEAKKN